MDLLNRSRIFTLVLLLLAMAIPASAQSREYKLKAAFIYNFVKFVEWPSTQGPIKVAILGQDVFDGELNKLETRKVDGRPLEVSVINDVGQATDYHVVFLADTTQAQKLLNRVQGKPVLTISDEPGFSQKGGGITLTSARNRIRFQINKKTLDKANLRPNTRLLALASQVFQ